MASTYRPTAAEGTTVQRGTVQGATGADVIRGVSGLQMMLRIDLTVVPIIMGADKFFHFLVNWDEYLAPVISNNLPGITGHQFMLIAGVIEMVAGLIVAVAPQVGGYLVMAWLWAIIINLLLIPEYFDIAVRDFGLSLGALTLARLTQLLQRVSPMGETASAPATERVSEYAEPPR